MRVVNGGMKKLVEGIRKARKAYERLLQKKSEGMKEEEIGDRYAVKGIIYQQNRGIKEEWKISNPAAARSVRINAKDRENKER